MKLMITDTYDLSLHSILIYLHRLHYPKQYGKITEFVSFKKPNSDRTLTIKSGFDFG